MPVAFFNVDADSGCCRIRVEILRLCFRMTKKERSSLCGINE